MLRLFALAALALALAACHRDRAPVDELAALTARHATAPGSTVIIERGGTIILEGAYGFADLENRVPTTPDSVFCIGSVSKQFGAAAIMQLVEAGTLSLDDHLAKFMPAFPRADQITIRNLLQHTSGIVDFEYNGTWPTSMGLERTTDEVIATFRDLPPLFDPGTRWDYSSSNYILLGKILEQLAGEPLAQLIKKRVFDRAGLAHTQFCESYTLIPNRVRGYVKGPTGWVPAPWSHLTQFGFAGGICSTARDLLKWQHALEEGKVVSAASYREMSTPGTLADGQPIHYGLGLSELRLANHRRIMHTGGVSGFGAMLEHFPEDDLRIVELTNSRADSSAHALATFLLHLPPARAVPISPAKLARYAIEVEPSLLGHVKFTVDRDQLAIAVDRTTIPLVHIGDGVFETADHHVRVRFEVTNNAVTRVLFASDDAIMTLQPIAPSPPTPEAPAVPN